MTTAMIIAMALVAIVAARLLGERRSGHGHPVPPQSASARILKPATPALGSLWPPITPTVVSPAVPADGPGTIEICGAGRVPVDHKDPFAIHADISRLTDARSTEWLSALRNSDDNRARAAGLMLRGKVGGGLEGQIMTQEDRDALVQMAVGSGDPAVYAMAVYACHIDGNPLPDGACPQLSLSAWAQMDAANAVPWLLLAQQARVRGDDAAAASAFAQAAKAQKVDSYNYSLFTFADPDEPKDTTPLERWSFALQVAGVESALQPPHAAAALRYCSEEAIQDSTVWQECNAVAELYVNKSGTLIDFAMGTSIGQRMGWPAERVNALNQEKFAMMETLMEAGPVDDDLWSCNSVARGNAYWNQRLRLGELGASREALAQTAESPDELAQKFADRMSKHAENRPASE